jgi:S1-C subfamily serine protease
MTDRREIRGRIAAAVVLAGALVAGYVARMAPAGAPEKEAPALKVDKRVLEAEKKRVAAIEKVRAAVVAVISAGGSGVIVDEEGYALTNFHVTSSRPTLKCGLSDGVLYDAVLVGEDKVGDVALIKLIPKKVDGKIVAPKGGKFPYAKLGDSDKTRAGDWSLAMGNPFLLSTDFTPTVTFGLISGVHRYQEPAGLLLEYTDCIQIDTSINPGNSGGPLFNMDGELIGINGRGSFEKRGRVNSGVGYAISINQIKNFMGQLRAGLDTDHASLGASMQSEAEDGGLSRILVNSILGDSDARRRGMDVGDQLVSFAGRPMTTVNQYKNVLGLFPRGWRVPIHYRRENTNHKVLVRLMGIIPKEEGAPKPGPVIRPPASGPAGKFFKYKKGFANYYFNELAQKRVMTDFYKVAGDFRKKQGDWTIFAKGTLNTGGGKGKEVNAAINIKEKGAADKKSPKVIADIDALDYTLEPLNSSEKADNFKAPTESGGLLLALYQYRQFLAFGMKGFRDFTHGGVEPFYHWWGNGAKPDFNKVRVDAEVLLTKHAGIPARWYFAVADDKGGRWKKGQLIGFEVTADRDEDPCEVCVSNYKAVAGGKLPYRLQVRRGDNNYATFNITRYEMK